MKIKNESDQVLDFIKVILEKVFAFKYVYIASFILCIAYAYLYNKYSIKVYEISTTIGPAKDPRSSMLVSNNMFSNSSTSILVDAVNTLNSFDLIFKTINNLNFEIGYLTDTSSIFKRSSEIYLKSPFYVNIDKLHIQTINTKFFVTILTDSTFRLEASDEKSTLYNYYNNETISDNQIINIDTLCKFDKIITNRVFKFSVGTNKEFLQNAIAQRKRYSFELYNPEELAKATMKALKVKPLSYYGAIIEVKYYGTNLIKSLDFLNSFIGYYLEDNLAKKNKIALSTINFIDSQISEMSDSLIISGSELSSFKSNNQSIDLSNQGKSVYDQLAVIEANRINLELQSRYYNSLLNYFKTSQDISGVSPPSSANINDQILSDLIKKITDLIAERSTISNTNERNVFLTQIDNKITTQRQLIINHVTSSLNTTNVTLNELNNRTAELKRNLSRLPKQEMNMNNIQRKYNLNNEQYSYLLQKRSEASITLASTYPDFEVIEPAREITAKKIKPKVKTNYLLSLFIGGLIPSILLILRIFLNNKINSIDIIERLIDRPVFGVIYSNPQKNESVVTESPKSAISESFRNLRSSLFLKLKSEQSKVILVTSSQPQDGKSFISYNLASSISSVGLKTIIIDCDLRRPTLHSKFKDDNSYGISDFLKLNLIEDRIIHKSSVENLFFIPAGHIIQNPSELISKGVLDDLVNYLKTRFEYIIIDAPPIGIVADTIQLTKYASDILLVARINYTKKNTLLNAFTVLDSNKVISFEVIINDQNFKKSPYTGYTNYYTKE
jgi:tyrosine-protein kinase Etk/Wzc